HSGTTTNAIATSTITAATARNPLTEKVSKGQNSDYSRGRIAAALPGLEPRRPPDRGRLTWIKNTIDSTKPDLFKYGPAGTAKRTPRKALTARGGATATWQHRRQVCSGQEERSRCGTEPSLNIATTAT
ncbi:MAG TPA: hypothetical protein VFV17_09745, partial [Usitatibacteraceae bacterium]|nr:hypothetical protein [Usitatibacteraceae bacterium]